MPSKNPSELPELEQDAMMDSEVETDQTEEFISLNEEVIEKLATFIDFAEGFTIGFVEINFWADLDILIQHLKTHPKCADTQLIELTLDDPSLRFLKDELVKRLQNYLLIPEKRPIVWIKGLENSIGMSGDYPPVLVDLNFVRDAFIESAPYPVLFCLPDYAINRVIQYAPDFWSWKSGVFRFKTRPSIQKLAADKTIDSDRIRESLLLEDWQERIDTLERLAMEYRPTSEPTKAELENYCWALMELGIAYRGLGEISKAEYNLRQAIEVAKGVESLSHQKGLLLHELGRICSDTGRIQEAEDLYKASIEIKEALGDNRNKAATLHQLGILKANQGEIEAAIILYQQSLDINEQIGNVKSKAATLHQLAILKADQGEIEEAIALYQQSLDIKEKIGDVQGKAATLRKLGGIYQQKAEVNKAQNLFQESLKIEEKIGNVQGIAESLDWIAGLKSQQGSIEEAISLHKKSLSLHEQIGNVKNQATTLHNLATLKANQGEIEEAIALFQQSLDITEQIGDVQTKAITLQWIGGLAADVNEDYDTGIRCFQESLGILQRIGSPKAEEAQQWLERIQALAAERAQSSEA